MREMPSRRDGTPPPAYCDATGPWWQSPDIPYWWVRPLHWIYEDGDGYEAKHQDGYLADVRAPSMYLLAVFTKQRQFAYVLHQ